MASLVTAPLEATVQVIVENIVPTLTELKVDDSHEKIAGWRHVWRAATRKLCFIWLLVVVMLFLGAHYGSASSNPTLAALLFAALTVMWVVTSRAISSRKRELLYWLWLTSMCFTVSWFSPSFDLSSAAGFAITASAGFMVLSLVVRFLLLRTLLPAISGLFLVCGLIALIGCLSTYAVSGNLYLALFAVCWIYLCIHALSIWAYLHQVKDVWLVDDTALFAIFSPLSTTVDKFKYFV